MAEGEEGAFPGEYMGLNPKRSHLVRTLDCPKEVRVLPKESWEVHPGGVEDRGGMTHEPSRPEEHQGSPG